MKVSVIIPTHNRQHLIERSVLSVLKQTYKNIEVIIVDDGSTDETYFKVKKLLEDKRVQYIRCENKGVSAARNLGAACSSGDYLAFLDSDDEWLKYKLEKQVNFIESNRDVHCLHTNEQWIRNGKKVNQRKIHQKFGGRIFEKCLSLCFISPSTVIISRDVFLEVGSFDEEFIVCEDFDLWLKLSSLYEIHYIDEVLINKYGGHEDQLSMKYFAMDYWRVKALANILVLRELGQTQVELVKESIIRKCEVLIQGYKKHENFTNLSEVQEILNDHLS